jgi:hypothetical protein
MPSGNPIDALLEQVADRAVERAIERMSEIAPALPAGPPPLLDRKGLAKALRVSVPTVDRLRREGLPTIYITSEAPRWRLEDAIGWLRERGDRDPQPACAPERGDRGVAAVGGRRP